MSSARSILEDGPATVGLTVTLFSICLTYRLSVIESLISEPDMLALLMNMLGLAFYCAAIYVLTRLPKTYRVLGASDQVGMPHQFDISGLHSSLGHAGCHSNPAFRL